MKNKIKCIYCGTDLNLSVSDIIPDSITTAKCKNNNVCKVCNNATNTMFENKFANQFAYFRNRLGYTKRGTNEIVPYLADIYINKQPTSRTKPSFRKKFTTYKDFIINNCIFDQNNHVVGFKNANPKFKQLSNPKILHFCNINYKELFLSSTTLRTVAKICYEWHCKQNNIYDVHNRYSRIIDYISGRCKNTIIEVVDDQFFREHTLKMLGYCQGSHALLEYKENKQRIVLFTMFGVVWYKVRVCKDFESSVTFEELHQYSLDKEIRVNISNGVGVKLALVSGETEYQKNIFFKPFSIKIHNIQISTRVVWTQEMRQLLGGLILTRPKLNSLILELEKDNYLNQEIKYYYDMFIYREDQKIYTIMLLYTISSIGYDNSKKFIENLGNWVDSTIKGGDYITFWNANIVTNYEKFISTITNGVTIVKSIPPYQI